MTKRRLIKHLWPKSLTAQLVCLLLGAIILTHIVLGILLADERRDAVAFERKNYALARVAAISRILTTTPRENWHDVLRVAQSPQTRLRILTPDELPKDGRDGSQFLSSKLNEFLASSPETPAHVYVLSEDGCWDHKKSLHDAKNEYLNGTAAYGVKPQDGGEQSHQDKRREDGGFGD